MRILTIEDDADFAAILNLMLRGEGFDVHSVATGEEGVERSKLNNHDLILLDLNLPDMSGFDVLRSLRNARVRTPILILSAISSIGSKVTGLSFGADDYLTKPFHKDELLGRLHAIMRRSAAHADTLVRCGDLVINFEAQRADIAGKVVRLTKKEFQILELLALRKGSTITKEMLLNHLYGGMDEPVPKIIDVFLCKVRRKLAARSGGKDYIETVWGRGYMLRDPASIALAGRTPA